MARRAVLLLAFQVLVAAVAQAQPLPDAVL
jgi:hypothetical protein